MVTRNFCLLTSTRFLAIQMLWLSSVRCNIVLALCVEILQHRKRIPVLPDSCSRTEYAKFLLILFPHLFLSSEENMAFLVTL